MSDEKPKRDVVKEIADLVDTDRAAAIAIAVGELAAAANGIRELGEAALRTAGAAGDRGGREELERREEAHRLEVRELLERVERERQAERERSRAELEAARTVHKAELAKAAEAGRADLKGELAKIAGVGDLEELLAKALELGESEGYYPQALSIRREVNNTGPAGFGVKFNASVNAIDVGSVEGVAATRIGAIAALLEDADRKARARLERLRARVDGGA